MTRPQLRVSKCQDKSWSMKGYIEDNFVKMRRPEIFHNEERLLYTSVPISLYIDAFRVHGLSNPVNNFLPYS